MSNTIESERSRKMPRLLRSTGAVAVSAPVVVVLPGTRPQARRSRFVRRTAGRPGLRPRVSPRRVPAVLAAGPPSKYFFTLRPGERPVYGPVNRRGSALAAMVFCRLSDAPEAITPAVLSLRVAVVVPGRSR
ncbi:unnamed protein product [Macrosiphum euphorbiae]|uniref:Uncharacterized protein n=1 Tax=Macrosiphum euphorbiae TaxID=13131 RepID=A0AAV0YDA1_9HEMI|nr:unnamed protein product [Macrosiphum euphorbiae]